MKFTAKASDLAAAAAQVAKISPAKNAIPILGHTLLRASDSGLNLVGHDLDRSLVIAAEVDVSEPGAATCDARRLSKLLQAVDGKSAVKISTDEKQMTLTAGRSRYRFDMLSPADFPPPLMPGQNVEEEKEPIRLAEMMLDDGARHRLFELTQFAISTEETRYYLNGVFLTAADGKALGVATDGHRLACSSAAVSFTQPWPAIIVPRPAVESIIALKAEKLITDGRVLQAFAEDIVFASKTIDGTFPDCSRVVPAASGSNVEFDIDEMLGALSRLRAVANKEDAQKRSGVCGIEWSAGGDTLTLCLPRADTAQDAIAATASDDDRGGHFACSINYLADALENLDAERAIIDSADPGSPVRIMAPAKDDVLSVLMPMRW
jgi:DNA polymerase III subunit beta